MILVSDVMPPLIYAIIRLMSKFVLFLDIDDTLTNTSRLTADQLEVLEKSLAKIGREKAAQITQEFFTSFSRQFDQHQGLKLSVMDKARLKSDLEKMSKRQNSIVQKFGKPKIWSREAWIYLSAEKHGINLSNNDLIYITNCLWSKISQTTKFYSDTLPFLKFLVQKKIPFYLITASDCRLQFDEKKGQFIYNPRYSHKLKMDRLKIFTDLGIPKKHIFIADPFDKPDPWVFQKALDYTCKETKEGKFISIMIGDSLANDLIPAKKAVMNKLFLIKREGSGNDPIIQEDVQIIRSLSYFTQTEFYKLSEE